LNELISLLGEVLNRPIAHRHLMSRPFDVSVNVLSNQLASQELGWAPQVALREGIVRTIQWMQGEQSK
jgi:nucleoside-diphosphate-sugar epimerase